jgi:BASS family bile acid:Na+ symporter
MIENLLEHYPHYHRLVAATQLVLAMLGMGLVTRPRAFVEVVLEPKPMITGVLYQLVGIPLFTAAMVFAFDFQAEIAVGFFMVGAVPRG